MIRQNIKIAFRQIRFQGKYSVLNILGLSIGLSVTILMVLLIQYELSFDAFHPKSDRIYKICTHDLKSGEFLSYTPIPLPLTLQNDFPEVEYVTGVWNLFGEEAEMGYNGLTYSGFRGASVEPTIFNVFDYDLILGKIEDQLVTPDQIVIAENVANKIFGDANPIGQQIDFYEHTFSISGVFKDLPSNSAVSFDVLFSDKIRSLINPDYKKAWWNGGMHTYVVLHEKVNTDEFETHLRKIPDQYFPDFLKGRENFFIEPFSKIHLCNDIKGGLVVAVSPIYLIILGSIALITLLISCINFINLAIFQNSKRLVDTSIRRIIGAKEIHLFSLQLWNTFLHVSLATMVSILIIRFAIPYYENLTEKSFGSIVNYFQFRLTLLAILTLVILIASFVPEMLRRQSTNLSSLKGIKKKGGITTNLQNGFVIFQFTASIILISALLVILKQISFMRGADLGYDPENLFAIEVSHIEALNYNNKYKKTVQFLELIEREGPQFGIDKGVVTENIPGYYYQNSFTVVPEKAIIDECLVTSSAIDQNFLEVYNIKMKHGRFFSREYSTDRNALIINETLMKKFGWKDVQDKYIRLHHEGDFVPVVGVISDIHITTLREPIDPMIFRFGQHNNSPGYITFRVNPEKQKAAIAYIQKKWIEMFSDYPFNYFSVKDRYLQNYSEEKKVAKIIGNFAFTSILLCSFGLLGIIAFTTEYKKKEIGVRKVNGAKNSEIIRLLNTRIIIWIAVSFLIGCPLSYMITNTYLKNFAYKIIPGWWVFTLAGLLLLVISILVVSWQSWKAATRNPVEALRYE